MPYRWYSEHLPSRVEWFGMTTDPRRALAEEFGLRVKVRRTALRLSRTQLGEQAGLSPRRIATIERGEHMSDVATLVALRHALDCPWETLLDELDEFLD
jgi:transcriptional regulator with XRE-family HTH domain